MTMIERIMTWGVVIGMCLACRAGQPTTPAPKPEPMPTDVRPDSLVWAYRDLPADRAADLWTDKLIRVTLAAESYTVADGEIRFHSGLRSSPPVIVFRGEGMPRDNEEVCVLVGVCRGIVTDGKNRGMGIKFCVVVDGCRATPFRRIVRGN